MSPRNRQPPGRPAGGRYAPTVHREPACGLRPPVQPLSDEELLIARLEEEAELEAIAMDEQIRDDLAARFRSSGPDRR